MDALSTSRPSDGGWAEWFRKSSDKWLLTAIIGVFVAYGEHVLHHDPSQSQIQIINGWINIVLGGLMVLVTQAVTSKLASATASTREDPRTGLTVGTLELKTPKENE